MIGPTAVFGPGWWYTAPPGTLEPSNTVQQAADASQFIDAWPEEWTLAAGNLAARLVRTDGAYLLRMGLAFPAQQVQKALTGKHAALGYESADFTTRAVFRMAIFDTRPACPPTGDVFIGAGEKPNFKVYTAGVVHGLGAWVAHRIIEP